MFSTEEVILIVGVALAVAGALIGFYFHRVTSWGDMAGPLFAFASSLLFVVAIMFQMREHRQAIAEMEHANRNHAELALIAKQEKEFNVMVSAIAEVRAHIDGIDMGNRSTYGVAAIAGVVNKWKVHLSVTYLSAQSEGRRMIALRNEWLPGILESHETIDELVAKLYWIAVAVKEKPIDERDREYLIVRVSPMLRDVLFALHPMPFIVSQVDQVLKDPSARALVEQIGKGLERAKAKLENINAEMDRIRDVRKSWQGISTGHAAAAKET